jgi:hypothetical protein
VETIPETLRKRKDIINQFRKDPKQKLDSVTEIVEEISGMAELEEWGLSFSTTPYEFETRLLQKPYLLTGSQSATPSRTAIIDKQSFSK